MTEIMIAATALLAGLLVGIGFFGGLWWTVRHSLLSKYPGAWFFGSLLIRTGLALSAFYGLSRLADWRSLVVALAGFIGGRFVVEWQTRQPAQVVDEPAEEGEP